MDSKIDFLLFQAGGVKWGVQLEMVRGINQRAEGQIPLISLAKRLKLPSQRDRKRQQVVVMDTTKGLIGLLVDQVDRIVRLQPEKHIFPLPKLIRSKKREDWIWGVAQVEEDLILLLEPED